MDQEECARRFANQFSLIDPTMSGVGEHQMREAIKARATLEGMMSNGEASSDVIARAMTIAIENCNAGFIPGKIAILNAYLQRKLTEEHVVAQQDMTSAADRLQEAANRVANSSYWMAVASFIVTAAALVK
jgi:hypothetical protein